MKTQIGSGEWLVSGAIASRTVAIALNPAELKLAKLPTVFGIFTWRKWLIGALPQNFSEKSGVFTIYS